MVPALILALSVVGLLRFAISYWRAMLLSVSRQPISPEVRAAAGLERETISGRDFAALTGVDRVTPGAPAGVTFVSLYFHLVEAIGFLAQRQSAIASWAEGEMTACLTGTCAYRSATSR